MAIATPIEGAVRSQLVGMLDGVGEKIYTWLAPEGIAAPYIVISRVAETYQHASIGDNDCRTHTIQVAVYTPDPLFASRANLAVRAKLHGQRWATADYKIVRCMIDAELITAMEPETKLYGAITRYDVSYFILS